jgi:hypothetical protein
MFVESWKIPVKQINNGELLVSLNTQERFHPARTGGSLPLKGLNTPNLLGNFCAISLLLFHSVSPFQTPPTMTLGLRLRHAQPGNDGAPGTFWQRRPHDVFMVLLGVAEYDAISL